MLLPGCKGCLDVQWDRILAQVILLLLLGILTVRALVRAGRTHLGFVRDWEVMEGLRWIWDRWRLRWQFEAWWAAV